MFAGRMEGEGVTEDDILQSNHPGRGAEVRSEGGPNMVIIFIGTLSFIDNLKVILHQ